MWAMMSTLQMLSYLTLVRLRYPANLLIFFDNLEAVHTYNSWMPNIFDYILNKKELNLESYNPAFEQRGLSNRNMLLLCGPDLMVLLMFGLLLLLLIPLARVSS
jgi:hypothetical protein